MIETFSEAIAKKLKQLNPEETRSVEVMKYGLAMSLNLLLSVGCSLWIGYMTNKLDETIEVIIAFAVLRRFSGGRHAPNLTACFVVSLIIFTSIPYLVSVSREWFLWTANGATALLVLAFAHTDYNGRKRYVYKTISMIIVGLGMLYESASVTLVMFVQAILLIKRR